MKGNNKSGNAKSAANNILCKKNQC